MSTFPNDNATRLIVAGEREFSGTGRVLSMKVYIGFGSYPYVESALRAEGAQIVSSLEEADAFVFTQIPRREFPELPDNIQWVQLPHAGINDYIAAGVVTSDRRWSNASGVYGRQVAEGALALLLSLRHAIPAMVRADRWPQDLRIDTATSQLAGTRTAVVGMGGIGKALEEMLVTFETEVVPLGREDQLLDVAGDVDQVILCCPLTADTKRMVDAQVLAAMKPSALLINVARGEVVDTDALVAALDAGEIAGAGLDVTDPEPLPDSHPLWGRDNVVITPHTANTIHSMDRLLAPVVAENYRRFVAGDRMLTEVDPGRGY
ncbi:D-isomer specific 2-hydroxyacid dehydrogenase family protein [Corynebacterium sp.]|uniref:D-isomer specific 2-hydroxyacid dehydrogenase family protein n=1 Tax=Corynebacterium sp. TaxID=1720 RepID=UPI0026DD8502|nr:D-isomer specific 2-hydroxyacid dehydrogenase family protein [Corynebacterium sp.]MDO5076068.1 D-isomer specific 2-hydroxyacid dehydrogenase family protein [Corynebacterium sp.]